MTSPKRIDIEVGGKSYNISITSIPYFASYADVQRHSGQTTEKHDDIPLFEVAYQGVEQGFRYCFRKLGTDLTEYHALCDTLDLLCIDTLGGRSIDAISEDLKSGKGYYDSEERRFVRVSKAEARESCFRLLYAIMTVDFEHETKTRQKVYNAVLFVVSHRAIFKYYARKTIRAAYEERFYLSEKHRGSLEKWPLTEPGTGDAWSDHDVATEESSFDEIDWDDY